MSRLRYSNRANLDLIRLYKFLADKDAAVAVRAITEIRDAMVSLSLMPKMGRPINEDIREFIIDFGASGYIALYDFDEMLDEVVVLAVRHQLENDYK